MLRFFLDIEMKTKPIVNSNYFISQWVSTERWTLKYALDTDLFKKKNLYQVKFKLKDSNHA